MVRVTLLSLLLSLSFVFPASRSEAKTIKAITYNVWGLPYPISKRIGRFSLIRKLLPKFDADVIALQETFTRKARQSAKMKSYPYKVYGPGPSFLNFSSGLVIMSRHPIIETKKITFNQCQGWDCFANKGVVMARVRIDNEEIDFYSTHLNAEGEDEGPRFFQLRDLMEFVKDNSTGRKFVLLGDFNFPDSSFLYQLLTFELQLNDSHREYVLANPDLPDDIARGATSSSGKRIDYVFTTPEFSVDRVDVIFKDKIFKGRQLSDHRAVLSTLDF